jgi:NAD+ synthase (glutamine-hydrolysing)
MKISLCQINTVMGDIAGNTAKIGAALASVRGERPDIAVFSELCVQGYPPSDLLEQTWFIDHSQSALDRLCEYSRQSAPTAILAGCAMPAPGPGSKRLANAAVLIENGKIVFRQDKSLLPTYDVFDERRYFEPARTVEVFPFRGERLGITICEDAWNDPALWPDAPYAIDPVAQLAGKGATLFINISGSPFHVGKQAVRRAILRNHAKRHAIPFVYVNQVGGNDELIFDGNSLVFDGNGDCCMQLPGFEEAIATADSTALSQQMDARELDTIGCVHQALCLGLKDYMHKCSFARALVGLSGGVDSAVTCALAAEALGPENVTGVTMPSRYSSQGSVDDSRTLAENLGIRFKTITIEPVYEACLKSLKDHFEGRAPDIAEENIQARIRGTILMSLSNKFGCLLLSTGNKSEIAVGYCTLYGDMNGGLSVISDLPKTMVYKLAEYINRDREIIPNATIAKPPSAELRPNQTDQDTLPPYEILDPIIELLVEKGKSIAEIVSDGFDKKTVAWVAEAVRKAEYKRRQAAPGLKVTPKAFGMGRKFPLAANYRR